jgi:hypothetical protein
MWRTIRCGRASWRGASGPPDRQAPLTPNARRSWRGCRQRYRQAGKVRVPRPRLVAGRYPAHRFMVSSALRLAPCAWLRACGPAWARSAPGERLISRTAPQFLERLFTLACIHPAPLDGGSRPPCMRHDCGHSATALDVADGGSGISWFTGPVRPLTVLQVWPWKSSSTGRSAANSFGTGALRHPREQDFGHGRSRLRHSIASRTTR